MSVIKGNPQFDFREQNPIISSISSFGLVYKNNKPDVASKKCWSMYMIEEADINNNPAARIIDREDRIKNIQTSYYNIDTTSEEYKILADDFSRFLLTKEESLYRIHVSKFEELTAHLNNLDLGKDKDFDKYIKIMEKLDKMWKGLEMIKDKMIEVQSKNKIRGNAQLSKRDTKRR